MNTCATQWGYWHNELQLCITTRMGSIGWTTAPNAAGLHKKGGKHLTLQMFGLINIWTAAEVRQTVSAPQVASIRQRKHVCDKKQIRPRQFNAILSARVHLAAQHHVNSTNNPSLLWHLRKWLSHFNSKSCIYQAPHKGGDWQSLI